MSTPTLPLASENATVSAPAPGETTEQRFRRLEKVWNAETAFLSSVTDLCSHPAFQEIIGMGEAVVPLMLRDLEQQHGFWMWALPEITGADPVPEAERGMIGRMSEAWVRWGRENGYQW